MKWKTNLAQNFVLMLLLLTLFALNLNASVSIGHQNSPL
jgi:hypothetical protein